MTPSHSQPQHLHELGTTILATENHIEYQGKFLIHRRSDSKKLFPGFLIGPGGQIDEGEDVMAAASREIREETGVTVHPESIKLKAVGIHHRLDHGEVWVNFVTRSTLTSPPEIIKHSLEGTSAWLSLDELLASDKIFPPSKFYHDHVLPDRPGIMYTNLEWENYTLTRVLSQTVAL